MTNILIDTVMSDSIYLSNAKLNFTIYIAYRCRVLMITLTILAPRQTSITKWAVFYNWNTITHWLV